MRLVISWSLLKRRSMSPPQSLQPWNFSRIQAAQDTGLVLRAAATVCGLVACSIM
jgi:hypothetical protein